jgi:heme/copper-type cytochrome/quinol oxidase subunit 2
MDTTAEVLLIVVSAIMSVFLIVLIVAIGFCIALLRRVKKVVDRAEDVAESVESAAHAFGKSAAPIAIFKFIAKVVSHSQRHGKGRRNEKR